MLTGMVIESEQIIFFWLEVVVKSSKFGTLKHHSDLTFIVLVTISISYNNITFIKSVLFLLYCIKRSLQQSQIGHETAAVYRLQTSQQFDFGEAKDRERCRELTVALCPTRDKENYFSKQSKQNISNHHYTQHTPEIIYFSH